MATTVSMPQLGETVTEGTILRWAKQVGDQVEPGDVLVEISTDKVDTEVPSPVGGTVIEILVSEGDTVEVDTPLIVIGEAGEKPAESPASDPVQSSHLEPALEPIPEEQPSDPADPPKAADAPKAADPPKAADAPKAADPPKASGGLVTVEMPQLGETVTEGTILRWAKQPGDPVEVGDVLVEISTDKVDTEVPSPVAGTVDEVLVPEGETVEVGTALLTIRSGAGQEVSMAESTQPTVSSKSAPATSEERHSGEAASTDLRGRLLSPVVRRLVREHNLDISQIQGSGEGGRITRRDVEALVQPGTASVAPASSAPRPSTPPAVEAPARETQVAPAPRSTSRPGAAPAPVAAEAAATQPVAPPEPTKVTAASEEVPLNRLRLRIGENMTRAKQTAAHVWTTMEVDFERVERVRQRHKDAFKKKEGASLTYLPFIARATVDALHDFPVVNSSYYLEEKKAVFHKVVNLGIAIDLNQKGLVVATVRDADGLRLVGLAREIRELADKARGSGLGPDDVTASTFTITNPGPFGSFMSAPIINVPNTGILSTDAITKRPTVVTGTDGEDVIAIRHIGYLSLTWDHRAFDGSTAVLFLQKIKQNIETWDWEQELS